MLPQNPVWETYYQKAVISATETVFVITAHFCNVLSTE